MVLGEKLFEEKGKVIGMSIKSIEPEGVNYEQSFASSGKGLGRFPSFTNMGTINGVQAPDGNIYASGQGILTSLDGDTVTWKLYFVGKLEQGKISGLALVKPWTASQKLAWMNKTIVVIDTVHDQKTMESSNTGYEWK